jgi:hypothetical protein
MATTARPACDLYFWCDMWIEKTTAVCDPSKLTDRELDFLFPKSSRPSFDKVRNVFTREYNIEVSFSSPGSIGKHIKRALKLGFLFCHKDHEDLWNAKGRGFSWYDAHHVNNARLFAMHRKRIELKKEETPVTTDETPSSEVATPAQEGGASDGDGREGAAVAAAVVPVGGEWARAGEQAV